MKRNLKERGGRIFEAEKSKDGKISYPVVIISQGLGNLADKNYYSAEAIQSGVDVYEGKKAYFDHPTPNDEEQRPGRSVRELVGHYEDVKVEKDEDGLLVLRAKLVPIKSKEEAIGILDHAVEYKKKYPNEDYIGVSINGDGEGKKYDYEDFLKEIKPKSVEMEKISQAEGEPINVITKLTSAVSADLVTEAGAKGRILLESKKLLVRRNKMLEWMKKLLDGTAKKDKKMIEAAVAGMLQSEDEDEKKEGDEGEDEAKKKEAEEAELGKQAESLAKGLLNAKKESKKFEDESEAEYEARCMKQALGAAKKEADEAAAKSKSEDEDEKKEDSADGDGDGDADDKKDDKKKDDKKEGDDSKSDDKKDDDKDSDGDKMSKLMKQMDEMKKEIEGLKKGKAEAEVEAKKQHESAAKLSIEKKTKERSDLIDEVLFESGMPRYVTKDIRPVLEKCKTEAEIKETAKSLKEAYSKALESEFSKNLSKGFPEMNPSVDGASNDSLFLAKK